METRSGAEKEQNHLKTLALLAKFLWPAGRADLRLRVFAAILGLVLAKLINVGVPYLYKLTIDALTIPVGTSAFIVFPAALIFAYGGARISSQLFGELRDLIFVRVAQNAQREVAVMTFRHLHELSLAFHLDRQTGGLSRVIERGVHGIQFVLNFMTFNILPTILEIFLVSGILLYSFHFSFGTIVFSTIAIYILFTLVVTEKRLRHRKEMNRSDTQANARAVDSLLNYETVKYFSNEEHEYRRYDEALKAYEEAAVRSQRSLSFLNTGQGITIALGLIAVMLLAALGVSRKAMSVGDFVMINTYLIQLYLPLNFLGFVYREVKNSLVDMDKMFELKKVRSDVADGNDATELVISRGELEFRRVNFNYRPERKIIRDISFRIPAGKTLALVGPSGSGKSTISRLLFRFYDPQEGEILIDGSDIRGVSQQSLRRQIGMVPQDTVLFNDTIRYNIQYGNLEATPEMVESAARMASIHDFIVSLPSGYDTMVGERGLKLSGGEKQRVAIARTILKNPPILLFDEATSALDSGTEKEIQASLNRISRNRTTLIIAHRLSTIVHADEIIVLRDGKIRERGTHRQLLSRRGLYSGMWKDQQKHR